MSDAKDSTTPIGVTPTPPAADGRPLSEIVALLLALVWAGAVAMQFALASESVLTGPLSILMTLLVVFLPLALIWGIVSTARTIRALRDEAARLQVTVDAMRHAYVIGQQTGTAKPSVERKIEEIAAAQKKTESQLAMFTSRRDTALSVPSADRKAALSVPVANSADEQPALALGTPAEDLRAPLSVADFVRALHFPESPDDKAGFRALRLALEDRKSSRLIRAAQDVLTLLSQEGIYMDDLKPERCRPEIWRRFAAGERGRAIAGLGGVRDRSSLALTAARMREDPVFRDAAHHFLRSFDRTFAEFETNASDAELADLTETRTARAFMLFGRVTGIFD
ncbi:hypothetical protein [Szabonella alba]|uniref:Uncharacterized protein n=1 Tax=Szabonella alba TaxID=2804194 RepID=A0A8K0Y1H9_9RHOB|nr:hypothetical protein [Szabonella alba]MBL4916039.1 hypothetical protein [Szabonella alba]